MDVCDEGPQSADHTGVAITYFDAGLACARQKGWRTYKVPCGHDVMLDMPERLTEILQEAA